MESKFLGTTSLKVSRMGLGLAALGRPGYINLGHGRDLGQQRDIDTMEQHCHTMLQTAWDLGIRYFDAARSYGLAEQFLGNWLRQQEIDTNAVTVGSKWGYTYTADWQIQAEKHEVKDHSLAVLKRQWDETQDQLAGYLDLYQIHSATLESGVLDDKSVHAQLMEHKSTGIKIGLSLSGPQQAETLEKAMEIEIENTRLFDCVQATWNLLEPSVGDALAQASANGMGVIVKEALANGRLTSRNSDANFASKLHQIQSVAQKHGVDVDAIALAAVLAQPWADVVLSGASNKPQLESNLKAFDVSLSASDWAILTILSEPPNEYWQTRGHLDWN